MLSDGFITLRPFAADDVDALYDAARESVNEVYPYLPWLHPGFSLADAAATVARAVQDWAKYQSDFAITDATSGRMLGGCGLEVDRKYRQGIMGYWVRTSATGKGVTTAAVRVLARYGFEKLGAIRIEIIIALGNMASKRVGEKARAHFDGTLRNRIFQHGTARDAYMYSILPEDFGLAP